VTTVRHKNISSCGSTIYLYSKTVFGQRERSVLHNHIFASIYCFPPKSELPAFVPTSPSARSPSSTHFLLIALIRFNSLVWLIRFVRLTGLRLSPGSVLTCPHMNNKFMNQDCRPHAHHRSASGEGLPSHSNSKPETHNAKLPSMVHTRTGKIARLPEDVRLSVNQLLRNGVKYSAISARLEELGYAGISANNICNWKHGGFLEWYRETQAREALLAPLNALDHCTRSSDIIRWQQNTLSFVAEKFAAIIANFDHTRFIALLNKNPELLPKYVAAIASVSRSTSQLARSFDLLRPHEASLRAELAFGEVGSSLPLDTEDSPSTQPEARDTETVQASPIPATEDELSSERATDTLTPTRQIQPDTGKSSHFQREKLIQPALHQAPNPSPATISNGPRLVNNMWTTKL